MEEQRQKEMMKLLKSANTQLNTSMKMINDERYCIDISNQLLAVAALIKKANMIVLQNHLEHCVIEAAKADNGQEKIDEVILVLNKLINK